MNRLNRLLLQVSPVQLAQSVLAIKLQRDRHARHSIGGFKDSGRLPLVNQLV